MPRNRVFSGLTNTIFKAFKEQTDATYTPENGDPSKAVTIIFVPSHREVDETGDTPFGSTRPVAWVRKSDVQDPKYNDQIEIDGVTYLVRDKQFDGLETHKLILTEQ